MPLLSKKEHPDADGFHVQLKFDGSLAAVGDTPGVSSSKNVSLKLKRFLIDFTVAIVTPSPPQKYIYIKMCDMLNVFLHIHVGDRVRTESCVCWRWGARNCACT